MLIRVCNEERHWRVMHPNRMESLSFHDGSVAYDFADAMARELHSQTGQACAVRVEVSTGYVDTVRYG